MEPHLLNSDRAKLCSDDVLHIEQRNVEREILIQLDNFDCTTYYAMMVIGRRRSQSRAGLPIAVMSAASGWRLQQLAISRLDTPDNFATLANTPGASKETTIMPKILVYTDVIPT
ncbi:hypothetical protein PG999_004370 [Apiospora kogelbergensis]|uniref:Uncharacterized protein n=1 Tax=Apiospora kogelbergensis TaxID=1337665 RepID=A0AAW0QZ27_9PEZI